MGALTKHPGRHSPGGDAEALATCDLLRTYRTQTHLRTLGIDAIVALRYQCQAVLAETDRWLVYHHRRGE